MIVNYTSFNPCFIGNCSHTRNGEVQGKGLFVSILVLLETALILEKHKNFNF